MSVIPLHGETGEFISNVIQRSRAALFRRRLFLIFGAGDGARPNLTVWSLLKAVSRGDKNTDISKVTRPEDLLFWGGSDPIEHDLKALL